MVEVFQERGNAGANENSDNTSSKPNGASWTVGCKRNELGARKISKLGLNQILVEPNAIILDIGCGGGRDVKTLAKIAIDGKVYGIDYSEVSVELAKKHTKTIIDAGRAEIQHASVSSLPFEEDFFDLVTGIEAYYFWPDLNNDLKEIYRVLKPGGTLALINEGYVSENEKQTKKSEKWAKLGKFCIHTPIGLQQILNQVGYTDMEAFEEIKKGWLMIKGKKPLR